VFDNDLNSAKKMASSFYIKHKVVSNPKRSFGDESYIKGRDSFLLRFSASFVAVVVALASRTHSKAPPCGKESKGPFN